LQDYNLKPSDTLHLEAMINNGTNIIVSEDSEFDKIPIVKSYEYNISPPPEIIKDPALSIVIKFTEISQLQIYQTIIKSNHASRYYTDMKPIWIMIRQIGSLGKSRGSLIYKQGSTEAKILIRQPGFKPKISGVGLTLMRISS